MLMGKRRDTFDSPFDDYKIRAKMVDSNQKSTESAFDLSYQGAILMILSVISFTLEISVNTNILLCGLMMILFCLVWMFTIRFIMVSQYTAINVLINYAYFIGMSLLTGNYLTISMSHSYGINCLPLVIGLSLVCSTEKHDLNGKRLVSELIIPLGLPLGLITVNCLLVNCFQINHSFLIVLMTALEIILFSYILSGIKGKPILFVGGRISDIADIPQDIKNDGIRFFTGRVIDLAVYLMEFTLFLFIYSRFGNKIRSEIYSILTIFLFSLYGIAVELIMMKSSRYGKACQSPFVFGFSQYLIYILGAVFMKMFAITPISDFSVFSFLSLVVIGFVVYAVLIGFSASYKRRLIFADINVHARGVPHFLLIIGIILMIVDAILVV